MLIWQETRCVKANSEASGGICAPGCPVCLEVAIYLCDQITALTVTVRFACLVDLTRIEVSPSGWSETKVVHREIELLGQAIFR